MIAGEGMREFRRRGRMDMDQAADRVVTENRGHGPR